MTLFNLYLIFMKIGLFSIGGGIAAIPLIQNEIVDIKKWITLNELVDIITISEMTPGPLAINTATFVGMKTASLPGAVIATLGFITPSLILTAFMIALYNKFKDSSIFQGIFAGLQPGIIGMMAAAAFSFMLVTAETGLAAVLTAIAAVLLLQIKRITPIMITIACGILGILIL